MPVEDIPVHEKVSISADKPYGCNGRKGFSKGYYAPDRVYRPDGTFYVVQAWIPYAMSTGCRNFYIWDTDPRCSSCDSERDTEYADKMKVME